MLLGVLCFWYVPRVRSHPEPASSGSSPSSVEPAASQPESSAPVAEALKRIAEEQPEVSADEVKQSIESQIDQGEKLTDERKLSELEKNLKKLESVASEESVGQVSSMIAESLGLDTDQYASRETAVEGTFDTESAQMSDVLRSKDEQGNWQYETLMVDAKGHQMRVPLSDEEGARLYETFEMMRQYPMARGVYESVVMPMMQKMLEEDLEPGGTEPYVIQPATDEE